MSNSMHYLEPEQLKQLLAAVQDSKRNVAMILLSVRHGLRASEVCGLQLSDIDEAAGQLLVHARKKGKAGGERYREALRPKDSFGPSDIAAIHQWLKVRETYTYAAKSQALFITRESGAMAPNTWTTAFQILAKKAGLPKELRHPHVMRHTCAMLAVNSGMPLHIVSGLLRHASLASLTPYVKPQQKDLDAAAIKAFSKF